MAKIMFNQYDTKAVSSVYPTTAYFFQVGVFSDIDNMNKEATKTEPQRALQVNDVAAGEPFDESLDSSAGNKPL